jgi:hypothetical protein
MEHHDRMLTIRSCSRCPYSYRVEFGSALATYYCDRLPKKRQGDGAKPGTILDICPLPYAPKQEG